MSIASTPVVNQLDGLDEELDTILTSFDTSYAWNYGSVKEGLRDLYEKAKLDQWNGTKPTSQCTAVAPKHGTFDPSKCGTYAGYRQHDRYDVPKCLPCKAQKSIRDAAAYARRVGIAA